MIQLKVNGVEQSFAGEPQMPLLWYLRDVLRLTGSKFGCGVGLCGACTVHVNGQATRTGEITATKGVIDQSNFQDYPVARINEVPRQTNVYIVDSDAPPAGVGEPGVPPLWRRSATLFLPQPASE